MHMLRVKLNPSPTVCTGCSESNANGFLLCHHIMTIQLVSSNLNVYYMNEPIIRDDHNIFIANNNKKPKNIIKSTIHVPTCIN